jgi:hypothetical protein
MIDYSNTKITVILKKSYRFCLSHLNYILYWMTLSFGPGTPAASTTKTGLHDIAEILLKVWLNTKNQKSCIIIEMAVFRTQTHTILVIGLYEFLGNPTT